MRAVVADAGAEVAADGASRGFLGIGGAHGVAPLQDCAIGFQHECDDFAGGHEVRKFAEERTCFVNGVEAAGFFFRQTHRFDRDDFESSFVNARQNFALLAGSDGVGFDDCESTFEGQEKLLLDVRR